MIKLSRKVKKIIIINIIVFSVLGIGIYKSISAINNEYKYNYIIMGKKRIKAQEPFRTQTINFCKDIIEKGKTVDISADNLKSDDADLYVNIKAEEITYTIFISTKKRYLIVNTDDITNVYSLDSKEVIEFVNIYSGNATNTPQNK